MNNPRSKESHSRIGDTSLDYAYDAASSAFRMQGPILGKVLILGALNAGAKPSKLGALIAVYNNSATTAWAKTGDDTVTAPTGGADGIALKPNDYTIIAMGADVKIITSTATCFGYEIVDDLTYSPKAGIVPA